MKRIDDDIRREHGAFEGDDETDFFQESIQKYLESVVQEAAQRVEDEILVDEAIDNLMRDCHMMKTTAPEIFLWNINGMLHRAKCLNCGRLATTDMIHRQFMIDGQHGITYFFVKVRRLCQCGHAVFRIQARRA